MKVGRYVMGNNAFFSKVKGAMYTMLAGLCQMLPDLATSYSSKISPLVLHNLDDNDPAICPNLWEATLSVVSCIQV